MSISTRFLALSAVYFGLASSVTLPPAAAQTAMPQSVETSRDDAERSDPGANPRQREFQHPMLESPSSSDMREGDPPQIERRGGKNIKKDGMMQRHVPTERGDALTSDGRKPLEASNR